MRSELRQINQASFAKRILAVIMDGAVTIFIMFAFMIFVFLPIANKGFHYEEKVAEGYQYQLASGLFVYYDVDENGGVNAYSLKDLDKTSDDTQFSIISSIEADDSFYIDHVKYYFLNYKTGIGVEYPEGANVEAFKAPNYKEEIDGKLPSEIYTLDWFNQKVEELKDTQDLMNFAFEDLSTQSFYVENSKQLKAIQSFIIFPSVFLSFSIFFIIIPLCFKNGETLGKKVMHIALINKSGFAVQKRQIVFRQTILLLYVFFCSFIIGVGLTSFATLFLGVFIYFLATIISKSHRSFADYAAYTLEIDTLTSVWFTDALEEGAKDEEIKENIKKYKKNKVENKNIIQVGSTIVNEDIKREIEEQNKEHKTK